MLMDRFEIPLDIDDVKIERVEFIKNNEIIITVKSTLEGTHCHRCGKKITASYGFGREITLRHLSILGKPTYIRIKPKRISMSLLQRSPNDDSEGIVV